MSDTNEMRREFEAWMHAAGKGRANAEMFEVDANGDYVLPTIYATFYGWQAATERATQLEPVAVIDGIDDYGPRIGWLTHWVKVGVGTKLYAAPHPAIRQGGTHD